MYILSTLKPITPPKVYKLLASHLGDKFNSPDQIALLAKAAIQQAPERTATTHQVLEVVRQRSDPALSKRILEVLAFYKVEDDEAVGFFRLSLAHGDPQIRAVAVAAVNQYGQGPYNGYYSELVRIADNEAELSQTRAAARNVLQR